MTVRADETMEAALLRVIAARYGAVHAPAAGIATRSQRCTTHPLS